MGSAEPPDDAAGGGEETIDAPIASTPPMQLPVERLELPVYRPRQHGAGARFWFAVLIGALVAIMVVVLVLT